LLLIVVNMCLQKGVIRPGLLSVLLVLPILPPLMASPLSEAVYGRRARRTGELGKAALGG